jgi:predicted GNAT family N-acyltransferase
VEGNKIFNDFTEPENISDRYKNGNTLVTCQKDGKIAGMIEVRDNNHIRLFFVDKKYHNMGIGKLPFNEALKKVKGKTDYIKVSASPFSEKIYSKSGFTRVDELTEKSGIKFIPMKLAL